MGKTLYTFALGISTAAAFAPAFPGAAPANRAALSLRMAGSQVGTTSGLPAGERTVTKVGDQDVMVVNNKNTIYALSPKCPHLGLPMKTGEITDDGSGPCITCKFHGSKFKLEDGSCVEWSESVMGIPGTKFLGNIVGNVGGAKNSPATVFDVQVTDGNIIVDPSKTGKSGASA